MPQPTDEVTVLFQDLEVMWRALDNAGVLAAALDIQNNVLEGQATMARRSKFTRQINHARDRAQGIIDGLADD